MADGSIHLQAEGPHPVDVAVGARIRLRRRDVGLSQSALAAKLGVSFQQVQKYERGANRISASMLARAARVLGVPVGWFFDEQGDAPAIDGELLQLLKSSGGQALLRAASTMPADRLPALVRVAQALTDPVAGGEA